MQTLNACTSELIPKRNHPNSFAILPFFLSERILKLNGHPEYSETYMLLLMKPPDLLQNVLHKKTPQNPELVNLKHVPYAQLFPLSLTIA